MANRSLVAFVVGRFSIWIIKYWLWLTLLWIANSSISWAQRLSYTIQTDQHQTKALRVTLTYNTSNTTMTLFRYANNYWGETGLGACLLVVNANAHLQRKTVGDWVELTVHHRPRQTLRLTYLIRPDQIAPLRYERTFRPIVEPDYFHLYGYGLFVLPMSYQTTTSRQLAVGIRWKLPAPWQLLTSFAPQTARRVVIHGPASRVESSVLAGGILHVQKLRVNNTLVWLATRPFRHLRLDRVARHLQIAVQAQRIFWRDSSRASLAVTLLPTYERQPADSQGRNVSVAGTALFNSFSAFATDNAGPVIEEQVDYLFFLELMHHWIGQQIRIRHEEKQYWFSEGFTEYVQTQLRLKTHALTTQQYVAELNKKFLQPLYRSPVRNVPNDSLTHNRFWTSQAYEKLPYRRGFLFALYIDLSLKQTTAYSLADYLRFLLACSYTTHQGGFTDTDLLSLMKQQTGFDPTLAYHRYIQQGQSIDFTALSLAPGLQAGFSTDGLPLFTLSADQADAFYRYMVR